MPQNRNRAGLLQKVFGLSYPQTMASHFLVQQSQHPPQPTLFTTPRALTRTNLCVPNDPKKPSSAKLHSIAGKHSHKASNTYARQNLEAQQHTKSSMPETRSTGHANTGEFALPSGPGRTYGACEILRHIFGPHLDVVQFCKTIAVIAIHGLGASIIKLQETLFSHPTCEQSMQYERRLLLDPASI